MKTKSLKIVSALVIGVFALVISAYAQQRDAVDTRTSHPVIEATAITKEEAQKKYPAKGGAYPAANRNPHDESGVVASPYPPYQKYNCSKVNHGGLVLDVRTKKVFVYP